MCLRNLFQLAFDNFDSNLDELYCILFTCIVLSDIISIENDDFEVHLSDINLIHVTSKWFPSSCIFVHYFILYIYGNKARRIAYKLVKEMDIFILFLLKGVYFFHDLHLKINCVFYASTVLRTIDSCAGQKFQR